MLSRGQSEIPKLTAISECGSRTSPHQARLPALTQAEPPSATGIELPTGLLSDVIESAENAILIADIQQVGAPIVHVNSAFENITGYSRAEIIGKNCRYLQGNDRLQPDIERIREG